MRSFLSALTLIALTTACSGDDVVDDSGADSSDSGTTDDTDGSDDTDGNDDTDTSDTPDFSGHWAFVSLTTDDGTTGPDSEPGMVGGVWMAPNGQTWTMDATLVPLTAGVPDEIQLDDGLSVTVDETHWLVGGEGGPMPFTWTLDGDTLTLDVDTAHPEYDTGDDGPSRIEVVRSPVDAALLGDWTVAAWTDADGTHTGTECVSVGHPATDQHWETEIIDLTVTEGSRWLQTITRTEWADSSCATQLSQETTAIDGWVDTRQGTVIYMVMESGNPLRIDATTTVDGSAVVIDISGCAPVGDCEDGMPSQIRLTARP